MLTASTNQTLIIITDLIISISGVMAIKSLLHISSVIVHYIPMLWLHYITQWINKYIDTKEVIYVQYTDKSWNPSTLNTISFKYSFL